METARDLERVLLVRCVDAARSSLLPASDAQEANVFRLAAMVIASRHPAYAVRLKCASEPYLSQHPSELLDAAGVLRRGWIVSLPRLRDMLCEQLQSRLP